MGRAQITRIRRSGRIEQLVDIRAPQDGVVIALNVGDGMYVQPGGTLISLSDLSSVWVLVNVFEDNALQMTTGLRTTLRLPFLPGREWQGQVDYVYPTIDPVSRTLTVRLSFDDVAGILMPNMYADVEIQGRAREGVLTIPVEALIRSSQGDRVILALGEGRFRPARVVAGVQSGNFIEIISGLREGEVVVTSSQFLIDSEASLNASLLRLSLEGERMIEPAADMIGTDGMDAPGPVITGRGVIESIMTGHNMIRLAHEPITALGWPAMVMSFTYSDEVEAEGLSAGQRVEFSLTELTDGTGGNYVISSVRVLGAAEDDQ